MVKSCSKHRLWIKKILFSCHFIYSVVDPGSGAFLSPKSEIKKNPVFFYFQELSGNNFWVKYTLNSLLLIRVPVPFLPWNWDPG